MSFIAKGKAIGGQIVRKAANTGPGLSLSSSSVAENSAQLTTVGAAVPINASNPGAVTITAQEFTNLFQMSGDGVTFELGAGFAAANHEVNPTAWVTFEYTDDAGTYQFTRTITITDVADGPTIAGAATDLETMIGAAETGALVTGDLGDLFVSPTSQTMTYVVSHGSVDVDGYTWEWTPSSAGATTVEVTATDEDGQSLQIEWVVDVIAANNAPTAADVTLEFVVPEGAAPAIVSSSPTDNATGIGLTVSPTVTFDRDIYFAASGTITLYSVTGAAAVEVFDVATDVGTGDGTISISGDTLTINPTAALSATTEYAIQWSAGAFTNFGGVDVAALTDTTTLSFTTTAGADVTEPTLSAPVDAANGGTAATGSVDTDEGNGTLYWVVTTSATAPSASQVKAGNDHTGSAAADSGSQPVSGTGTQALSPAPSGLTSETAYHIHFMHEDAAANQSAVASGDGFTTADVTAPTLSSPTDAANGSTAATASVSTNEGNGTLYWVITQSATSPSAAQVKAGNDHTGSAADDSGSQSVSGTGVQTLSPAPSGLTASTAYYAHFMHEDSSTNQSTVSSADGFTTAAAGGIAGHDAPQLVINSGADSGSYTGSNLTGVQSGERIYAVALALGNNNATSANTANWDLTVGGVSMSHSDDMNRTGVDSIAACYELDAPSTGDLATALNVSSGTLRAMSVYMWRISGHDTGTPTIVADALGHGTATQFIHPSGLTTSNNENVVIGAICTDGGDITGLAVAGADGSTTGATGANAFSDQDHGAAWLTKATVGSVSFDWTWTTGDTSAAGYFEIKKA